MALILRNGGSQSPDRWLRKPRNNQKENVVATEQMEKALYLMEVISTITDRGNNAEVRRKKDGSLAVYEVKKKIVTV